MFEQPECIEVKDLSFGWPGRILQNSLSFVIKNSQIAQIMGQNGQGKTTLLKILAGCLNPIGGSILYNQQKIWQAVSSYQKKILWLGTASYCYSKLTVLENLKIYSVVYNDKSRHSTFELDEVLDTLQLFPLRNQRAEQLSNGEKRRLAFSLLLLSDRAIWLLDEPLSFLDNAIENWLLSQIILHQQRGGITILSSHQPFKLTMDVQVQL